MKILRVGEELSHEDGRTDGRANCQADRQTDVIKLIVQHFHCPTNVHNVKKRTVIKIFLK